MREIVFTNEGGETAADLRYVIADESGRSSGSVGNLPPGVTTAARLDAAPLDPVQCVWVYGDAKNRLHVWSYDGRHKRLRRRRAASDEACFALMYA